MFVLYLTLALILLKLCWGLELKSCNKAPHDQLCKVNENYNNNKVPGSLPITLRPEIGISNVAEVNVNEGSITIFVDLAVEWEDRNIAHKPNEIRLVNYLLGRQEPLATSRFLK